MSDLMMCTSYEKEGFEESRIEWKLDADGNLVLSLSRTTVVMAPSSARRLAVWVLSRMSV